MYLNDLISLVRNVIEDNSSTDTDVHTYENSDIFTITESNVISVSEVRQNSSALDSGDWSYDSSNNKITISASCSAGDSIEIDYSYYPDYSDTEIVGQLKSAIMYLSIFGYKTFEEIDGYIYPDPTSEEKNLIAAIAGILIKPDNIEYSLPDFRVKVPQSLPTRDIIKQTIAMFKTKGHGIFFVT